MPLDPLPGSSTAVLPTEGAGDAQKTGDAQAAGTADAGGGETPYELNGIEFTPSTLKQWKEASDSRAGWEKKYKGLDQGLASLYGHLSKGFLRDIKSISELTDIDWSDLRVWATFNAYLRQHPEDQKPMSEVLTKFFEERGLTRGQAKAAAKEVVSTAAGAPLTKTDVDITKHPAFVDLQTRLARFEQSNTDSAISELSTFMDDTIEVSLRKYGEDIIVEWGPDIRDHVLYQIGQEPDEKLYGEATSGALASRIDEIVKAKVEGVHKRLGVSMTEEAKRLAKGKQTSVSPPLKGGAPGTKVVERNARPGMGLQEFGKALMDRAGEIPSTAD